MFSATHGFLLDISTIHRKLTNEPLYCSKECQIKGRKPKVKHICKNCGRKFTSKSGNSTWCDECRTITCIVCGNKFKVKPRRVKSAKYCSHECHSKGDMNHIWTKSNLEFIKANYPFKVSMKELAKKFNTSVSAIGRITAKLNLPKCPIELRQRRVGDAQMYWTKKKIISRLKELYKNGEELTSSNIQKKFGSLHMCACSRFGNWKKTIEAAGFNYDDINLYSNRITWTKELIIEEILKLHYKNYDLMASNVRDNKTALFVGARRVFGTWEKAIKKAGLNYEEILGELWGERYTGKDGRLYPSIIEGKVADELLKLIKKNIIINYETQVRVTKNRRWTCDFVVILSKKDKLWLEVDGLKESRREGRYDEGNEKIEYYKKHNFNYEIVTNPKQVKELFN